MDHPLHALCVREVDGHDAAEQTSLHTQLVIGRIPVVAVKDLCGDPVQRLEGPKCTSDHERATTLVSIS